MEREFFRNILIATDGSINSQRAAYYGVEIAKLSGASIYALYVVDTPSMISDTWTAGKEAIYEIIKKDGEKALSKVMSIGEASGVEIKKVILDGHPSTEIIDYAQNNNIDLIVMGTLGKTGLERFLMGSVAEKVVRGSKIPVMVVR